MTNTSMHSRGGQVARWLNLLLALAGCGVCLVLLRVSAGVASGGDAFSAAVCSPSQRINCDYVLSSPWARIGPLPAASVGLAYFATLAAWYVVVGLPNAAGRRWRLVPIVLTSAGLLASLFYTYIMAVYLPVWCTWCLAAHGVNALLFLGALVARPSVWLTPEQPHPTPVRALGVLGACAAMVVIQSLAVMVVQQHQSTRQLELAYLEAVNNPEYILMRWRQQSPMDPKLRDGEMSIGPDDAPHVLVVYTDFECGKCAWFHPYAERLMEIFPQQLRIVWRHYPVSPQCNAHVNKALHYYACEAAIAAEAARRVGDIAQAVRYHGLLYQNARRLSSRPYERLAREAGLNADAFAKLLEDETVRQRVAEDIEIATTMGVVATPTMFLDGRKLPTWHILSDEIRPRIDVGATDHLWRRLIAAESAE